MADRLSRSRRGTRRAGRVLAIVLLLMVALPAAAHAERVPVTVAITSVTNVSAGDGIFSGPDFFSRINIANGAWFRSVGVPDSATPSTSTWRHTVNVSATATGRRVTPIRIELYDNDDPFGNQMVDVDPGTCPGSPFDLGCASLSIGSRPAADTYGLDLSLDVRTGAFTAFGAGDATGPGGPTPTCVTGSEGGSATMCFTITLGTPIPETLTVTKTADTNDEVCTRNDCSLREAIFAAGSGDAINLPNLGAPYRLSYWDPTREPDDPLSEPGHLKITKALTIRGPRTGAIIQQTRPGVRVFDVHGGGLLALSNVTVTGGEAGNNSTAYFTHVHGGGIHNHGTVRLVNVTITGNSASIADQNYGGGGGLYNARTAELTNVTIASNDASARAGGLAGNPVTLRNTLIAHNTLDGGNLDCDGTHVNRGGNLEFPGDTCGMPVAATAPIAPLPVLGVFEPLPGSEAIDRVTGTQTRPPTPACPVRDQIGNARPLDGDGDGDARCDTGAIEFDPASVVEQALDSAGQPGPVRRPARATARPVSVPATATAFLCELA